MNAIFRFLLCQVALSLVMWGSFTEAHAQSITNGDLSKGNAGWKGNRVVENDPDKADNKVLVIELSKFSYKYFSQQIETGGGKSVTVSFDFKVSKDYQGDEGFVIQVPRAGGTYFTESHTEKPASWQHVDFTYSEVNGARKLDLSFKVTNGAGKIYFDNFKVTK